MLSAVPGDTQRNLNVRATFTNQRFKHILVPRLHLCGQVLSGGGERRDRPGTAAGLGWSKITLLVLGGDCAQHSGSAKTGVAPRDFLPSPCPSGHPTDLTSAVSECREGQLWPDPVGVLVRLTSG